jgi:hypothetical protein
MERCMNLLAVLEGREPHVNATGTMVQPLELFDTITGLDMDQFGKVRHTILDRERAGFPLDSRPFPSGASQCHPESAAHLARNHYIAEESQPARPCSA